MVNSRVERPGVQLSQAELWKRVGRMNIKPSEVLVEPNRGNILKQLGVVPVIVAPAPDVALSNEQGFIVNQDEPRILLLQQPEADTFDCCKG